MGKLVRAFAIACLLAGVLMVPRPALAWWYAWCPNIADAVMQSGGQFYVVGSAGHDPYFDVDLWNYEVSTYGEVFTGICVE